MQRWSQLLRMVLQGLATLLAASTILYSSLWMYLIRHQTADVELGFERQYFSANQGYLVQNVEPRSPAEQAGLRAGDRIIAVNGQALRNTQQADELWSRSHPGDLVELTVERPGQPGALTLHAIFRAARRQPSEGGLARAFALQLLNSYPIFFLVVGLTVLFLRFDEANAWLLALLFAGFIAASDVPDLGTLPAALATFVKTYRAIFFGLLAALFYLFFAVFPVRSPLDRRFPWLKWVAFVLGAWIVLPGLQTGNPRAPSIVANVLGPQLAERVLLSYMYLFFVLGFVSLVGNARRSSPPDACRKSRVLLWGTVIGVLPIATERAAADFVGFDAPFWLNAALVIVLLLYPLSFGYAVVKHRVMEIPALLKRSARYVLVQRGYVLLLLAVATAAIAVFTRIISRFFPANPGAGMGLSAAFGVALAWASAPMVRRGTQRIDRAFFRSAYDARMILQNLAAQTHAVTNRHELARLLETQIAGALHPKSLACYLESSDSKLVAQPARSSGQSDQVSSRLPRAQFPARFGAGFLLREFDEIPITLPLLTELAQRGKAWDVPPAFWIETAETSALSPECLVPILGRNSRLIGLLVLGQRLSEEPYSGEDKHLLDSVASQAGIALENIALAEKMAERMEVERKAAIEIDIARRVQSRLFPQKLPRIETLDYVGGCVQARQVGGDYYDFLDVEPGTLGIVLADVCGKGMSGALLMANLQANLRSQYAAALDDLPGLLQSVNRLFYQNTTDESFATMFFGLYESSSRRLRYCNCGHIAPLLVCADGAIKRLMSTTTVLGLFLQWDSPIEEVTLQPGDVLLVCTDGVTEAENPQRESYGEERLADIVRRNRNSPVSELLGIVQADVDKFSAGTQADDITLIVARCH